MISLKKSDVIQLVAVVKSLLKSRTIKNVKNIVAKILTLLTEPFTMSPNAPNKNSLDFLSDYYFNTKSPLALYREAKKRYPSLTFRQDKTWLQSNDTYTLHKPVRYIYTNFYSPVSMYFQNFAWVVPLKNKSGETLVNGFQSIFDLG